MLATTKGCLRDEEEGGKGVGSPSEGKGKEEKALTWLKHRLRPSFPSHYFVVLEKINNDTNIFINTQIDNVNLYKTHEYSSFVFKLVTFL